MSLNFSCFSKSPELPFIPEISQKSNNLVHVLYNWNGNTILSRLSSFICQSTYSSIDLQNLLKSWTLKVPTKLISSVIIYIVVILLILVALSIIFYTISYLNLKRFQSLKKTFCIIFFLIFSVLILIGMIFIVYDLNKTKDYLNQSIDEFNLNHISKHIQHLLKQLDHLTKNSKRILLDGSKSLMMKMVITILKKYYFVEEIEVFLSNLHRDLNELSSSELLDQNPKYLFEEFSNIYKNGLELNGKLCDYLKKDHLQIEEKFLDSFNPMIDQFHFYLQMINNQMNISFFNDNHKAQVRRSISFISILFFILLPIISIIPLIIFLVILFNYLYYHSRKIRKHSNERRSDTLSPNPTIFKERCSDQFLLCPIRLIFALILVLFIILSLISGLFYAIDLLLQSSCRLIHYDQPFLVSFLSEKVFKSFDDPNVNRTVHEVINACNKNEHFLERIFQEYSNDLKRLITNLNDQIYYQFFQSIDKIDITSKVQLLDQLTSLVPKTNDIHHRLITIQHQFTETGRIFTDILQHNSQLPVEFYNQTLNEFKSFFKRVIESSIDSCPLPMDYIHKIDRLICHEIGNTINGFWLRIFLFIFVVLVALYVFGLYVYKRLN